MLANIYAQIVDFVKDLWSNADDIALELAEEKAKEVIHTFLDPIVTEGLPSEYEDKIRAKLPSFLAGAAVEQIDDIVKGVAAAILDGVIAEAEKINPND